LDLNSRIICK